MFQSTAHHSRRSFLQATAALATAGTVLPRSAWTAQLARERLIVRQGDPLNAEPALADLVQAVTTPVDRFFIRTHGSVPKVEADQLKLRIEGMVAKPGEFSLVQLNERFARQSAEATITC